MKPHYIVLLILSLLIIGCSALGPKSVPRDRFDYNTAISNSWKEQTLLNIVKLRYADMPLFVQVASVVSGYTLESSVNLGGTLSSEGSDFFSLGGAGKYTDRPTITYVPITGQQFNRSFMLPIPPIAVLFLIQTGWPADMIFHITLDSVNGLRSRISGSANMRQGDPEFYRVIDLFRKIQKSGAIGIRVVKGDKMQETTVLSFYQEHLTLEIALALKEVSKLLGLKPGAREIKVSYGMIAENDSEIAMLTRSIMQIMVEFSSQVEIPTLHVNEGRVAPALVQHSKPGEKFEKLIRIKNATEKPEDAFTAVKYRDHWFWIDDRDFASKRIFTFLMVLFSITETGGKEGLPLITIPAG